LQRIARIVFLDRIPEAWILYVFEDGEESLILLRIRKRIRLSRLLLRLFG
jgi:hypothetical protein